jgi:cell fate regulator YaaT (PSP1 superfamily)
MIEAVPQLEATAVVPTQVYLVRYGTVPEVARFAYQGDAVLARGDRAVIDSHRGLQMGTVLERLKPSTKIDPAELDSRIDRAASPTDLADHQALVRQCEEAFAAWCTRISQWKLELELIDLEWTLDRQKLILYVLCERGPDSTKLALQAAAAGLGIIEVQPVSAEGPIQIAPSGGGCGSGGGGDGGGCGCSH